MFSFKYWQLAKGLGLTLVDEITGNSTAYTIIDIVKDSRNLVVQQDKAALQTPMVYGADGYSVQVLNQDEQQYKYERDLEGETLMIPFLNGNYFVENVLILPGRRQYTDFTGQELENLKEPLTKKKA